MNSSIKDKTPSRIMEILKVQSSLLKGFYDFFEEQNFIQILPVNISRITASFDKKSSQKEMVIRYQGKSLRLTESMVLHNQLACGKCKTDIFCQSSNIRILTQEEKKSGIHAIEYNQLDYEIIDKSLDDLIKFTEQMLRRVKIDVEHKCEEELKNLNYNQDSWKENFPVYTRHDLEVTYGENWSKLVSEDHEVPFWVICINPHFYDKIDEEQPGKHYLNFQLYMPSGFGKVMRGSEREYRYDSLIKAMQDLNYSRFEYSDYLLSASQNNLVSTSGASIGIEQLVRYFSTQDSISNVQLFNRMPDSEITI